MALNRFYIVVFAAFYCWLLPAQSDTQYLLTDASSRLGIAQFSLVDPYLSPAKYAGSGVVFSHKAHKLFNASNKSWSHQSKWNALAGMLNNESGLAGMMYFGGNYNWGAYYNLLQMKDFSVLAGANANALFGFKYLSRNVNNPVNFDMAIDLQMALALSYKFKVFRQPVYLQLDAESPLVGCMFVPMPGASYYEMFDLGSPVDAFHFSSLHNRHALRTDFMVTIPLNTFSVITGVGLQSLIYKANNSVYSFNNFTFQAGVRYQLRYFGGKKKAAPTNFIEPEL